MSVCFDPDSHNGEFVFNRCAHRAAVVECYRTDDDFVCDDCEAAYAKWLHDHRVGDGLTGGRVDREAGVE